MAEDYSGSDPSDNSYHHQGSETPVYGRHSSEVAPQNQYDQHQYQDSYGYQLQYPSTSGDSSGGGLYADLQGQYARVPAASEYYPPSHTHHLTHQQHQQLRNYDCTVLQSLDHHACVDSVELQHQPNTSDQHEMNYGGQQHRGSQPQRPNPRQQTQLQAQASPGYAPPSSHYGSPVHAHLGVHSYPSSQQQWTDYSSNQSPRVISSPASPSPAHTPTPPIVSPGVPLASPTSQPVHSPPLLTSHSRTPTPTPAVPILSGTMSGQYPAHHHHPLGPGGSSQSHALSWGHPNVSAQSQAIGMHQSGRPSTNSISPQPHNFFAPSVTSAPRGPQPLSRVTGGSPPPNVHSPPTTAVRCTPPWGAAHGGSGAVEGVRTTTTKAHGSSGSGNPLASLQLLVDQDMNRGGGGVPSASPYRGTVPPNAHSSSPSSIDLSSTKTGVEAGITPIPTIHSPRSHLVFSDGTSEGVRNGNAHGASSPAPLRAPVLNGEASSGGDSGIGSPSVGGGAPTPTPPLDSAPVISVRTGNLRDVGARAKMGPLGSEIDYLHGSHLGELEPLPLVAAGRRQAEEVADLSRTSQSRSLEVPQSPGETSNLPASGGNAGRTKVIALKRTKKVDAILENLVESGSKKLATGGNDQASPVSLVTTQSVNTSSETPLSTSVIAPTVVVSAPPAPPPIPSPTPVVSGEESASASALTSEGPSSALSRSPDSPPSQSPDSSPWKASQSIPKSPSRASGSADIEEEAVSPTFDDALGGDKPRRKRKPDNPLRLKTPDAEGPASSAVSGKTTPPESTLKESSSVDNATKSQEVVEVTDPPKTESNSEATYVVESIAEISKAVEEIKAEKEVDSVILVTNKDQSLIADKLSSPKTEGVELKREKTTPKTKAEQKYLYRQYEQGEVTVLQKRLDFEVGSSESPGKSTSGEVSAKNTPVTNAQKNLVVESKTKEEEDKQAANPSSSASCLSGANLLPQSTSVKVEEIVFGAEDTSPGKFTKKPEDTPHLNAPKVEGTDVSPIAHPENTVNILKPPVETLVPEIPPKESTSNVKPEVKNAFSEVEDQLAMMFAGIIEPEEGQESKSVPHMPASADKKSPDVKDSNEPKPAPPPTPGTASREVQDALTTPPSIVKKPTRGRPKLTANVSAGDTSCGSVEGSPRKRKRKRFPDDEDEDFESSTPRRTKKVKAQGSGVGDTSVIASTAGSEGEGSAVGVSTSESTPNAAVKRKKKRKKVGGDNKFSADFPREIPKKKVLVADEKQPRGPYIRMEGPRDGPRRVTVVNVGTRGGGAVGEDDEGGDRSGARARGRGRKLGVGGAKVSKDGSSRGGARAAVQSGTDASQPDRSWVCVFCRHGSHYGGLGDLFGPYFIGKDAPEDEVADDFERSDHLDSETGGDNGNKLGKGRRASGTVEASGCKSGKKQSRRRWSMTGSSPGLLPGTLDGVATPASPSESENGGRLEVWMHEECAVWAAGLYQIGSRIVGLNEAVWSSAKMMCAECGAAGANVGCVRRGCAQHLHYPCARDHGWQLDEEEFLATCPSHRKGSKSPGPVLPT